MKLHFLQKKKIKYRQVWLNKNTSLKLIALATRRMCLFPPTHERNGECCYQFIIDVRHKLILPRHLKTHLFANDRFHIYLFAQQLSQNINNKFNISTEPYSVLIYGLKTGMLGDEKCRPNIKVYATTTPL